MTIFTWNTADFNWNSNPYSWSEVVLILEIADGDGDTSRQGVKKKVDKLEAIGYTNRVFKDQVWNKDYGFDDALAKLEGKTKTQSQREQIRGSSVSGGSSGGSSSGGGGGGSSY